MCIAPLNVSMCLCCWQSEICVSISVRRIEWNSSYLYQRRRTKYNLHDQLPPPINYNKLPRKSIYVSLQSTLLYVRVGVTLSSVLFVGDCLSSVRFPRELYQIPKHFRSRGAKSFPDERSSAAK